MALTAIGFSAAPGHGDVMAFALTHGNLELNRIRISKRHRATCGWAGYLKQRGARSDAALELYLKPNRSWWRNEVDIMESGGGTAVRDITFAAAGSNLAQKLDLETRPDSSFMRAPS